jgi:hypothetical protein
MLTYKSRLYRRIFHFALGINTQTYSSGSCIYDSAHPVSNCSSVPMTVGVVRDKIRATLILLYTHDFALVCLDEMLDNRAHYSYIRDELAHAALHVYS